MQKRATGQKAAGERRCEPARRIASVLLTYLPLADSYLYERSLLPAKRMVIPQIGQSLVEAAQRLRERLGEESAERITRARGIKAEGEGMIDAVMYDIALHMTVYGEALNIAVDNRVVIVNNPDTMQYEYSPTRSVLVESERGAGALDAFFDALERHMHVKYCSPVTRPQELGCCDASYKLKPLRKTRNRKDQMCVSDYLRFPRDFERSLEAQRVPIPRQDEVSESTIMEFRRWFNDWYLTDPITAKIIANEKRKHGSSLFEHYMRSRPEL